MEHFLFKNNNIYYFKRLASTMDMATKFADNGCPNYTVVIAGQQSSGLGRLNRPWVSDFGGLYFSIIVRPNIPIDLSASIAFAVGIDLVYTVKDIFKLDASLKWPNDILIGNRKLCGILSRIKMYNKKITYINVGVGLNTNNTPRLVEKNAISISDLLGYKVNNCDVLSTFLSYFQLRDGNFKIKKIIQEWKQLNVTLGKFVRIITLKNKIEGIAIDLDFKGGLKVLMSDSSIKTITHGDCFLI